MSRFSQCYHVQRQPAIVHHTLIIRLCCAATLSKVTDIQQLELVNILLRYSADKAKTTQTNKLPIELVQHDRDRVGYHFVCSFRGISAHFSPIFNCCFFLNFQNCFSLVVYLIATLGSYNVICRVGDRNSK